MPVTSIRDCPGVQSDVQMGRLVATTYPMTAILADVQVYHVLKQTTQPVIYQQQYDLPPPSPSSTIWPSSTAP